MGKSVFPLRKRTKSQSQLLALAGEFNADTNNNEPVSPVQSVRTDNSKSTSGEPHKNATSSPDSSGTKKPGKISAAGRAGGVPTVKKKIIETTTTSIVHKTGAKSPAQKRDCVSQQSKNENNTRRTLKTTGATASAAENHDKKRPVSPLESEVNKNEVVIEHKKKATASASETSVIRKQITEQQKEHIHAVQQIHGLSLNSRVVFFEESGVPLHGTIKYIGVISSSDDVIYAGIELVSKQRVLL